MYGNEIQTEYDRGHSRSVIGNMKRTPAGNLVLEIGKTNTPRPGWEKTEHVVLTPAEVQRFLSEAVLQLQGDLPEPHRLAEEARERAEQEADERGVPIDQICVMASPFGIEKVIDLGEESIK